MLDKTTSTPALAHAPQRHVKTRPAMDPTDAGPTPASLDDLSWKASRKLKQQRDLQKRRHAIAQHHGKDRLATASWDQQQQQQHPQSATHHPHHHDSRGRSIPNRRKERLTSSPLMLSKSVPSASSWPPDQGLTTALDDCSLMENMDPNWELTPRDVLASSAPEESSLMREHNNQREARTMTLFDCATIFNEAGHLLSHEDFHEMGSSPEVGSFNRRKTKRRVGRHKVEKKKTDANDRLTPDEVVLELMVTLLPDVEVTKELNMLFLNRSRHHGGVFDFENDDSHECSTRKPQNCKLLTVDLLKFQVSLTSMLFEKEDNHHELPASSTSGLDLVDMYITDQWIAKTILNVVKLDVIAQYDAFAVMLAIFRTIPSRRRSIMKSVVAACLAIFDHQAMEHMTGSTARTRKYVSMKGVIAMLNGFLAVTEHELAEDSNRTGRISGGCRRILG
ncbi:hypothetical protein PINS_up000430 [Pythium insidiosum]|nr:hypothetical protein PINS_up000430 [Pythium insidiosum]